MKDRPLVEMHELAITAPEPVSDIRGRKAVSGWRSRRHQRLAVVITSGQAEVTTTARQIWLQGNTVADFHLPAFCRFGSDLDNTANRFMSWDKRITENAGCGHR